MIISCRNCIKSKYNNDCGDECKLKKVSPNQINNFCNFYDKFKPISMKFCEECEFSLILEKVCLGKIYCPFSFIYNLCRNRNRFVKK